MRREKKKNPMKSNQSNLAEHFEFSLNPRLLEQVALVICPRETGQSTGLLESLPHRAKPRKRHGWLVPGEDRTREDLRTMAPLNREISRSDHASLLLHGSHTIPWWRSSSPSFFHGSWENVERGRIRLFHTTVRFINCRSPAHNENRG